MRKLKKIKTSKSTTTYCESLCYKYVYLFLGFTINSPKHGKRNIAKDVYLRRDRYADSA